MPAGALTADEKKAVSWRSCDVTRMDDVRAAIEASKPDAVFHLAGVAFVPAADKDPGAAVDVNVGAAARLLGDVRARHARRHARPRGRHRGERRAVRAP